MNKSKSQPTSSSQANIKQNLKELLAYQPNPLIGRESEISYVKHLIQQTEVRLLTLLGPGGVGKTRLALQLATTLVEEGSQIYFVPLATLAQANLVLPALAEAFGLTESTEQTLLDQLKGRLQAEQHLLVMDNFEQVLEARTLLAELLSSSPALKVVVTSRSPLQITGEHQFNVPPLALPDADKLPASPLQLTQVAAVRLFEQRVQALRPDFKITAQNMATVARICVRLDGLPLALELAAGWASLLSPQALLNRLEHPLQMLTGGPLNAPDRQQTLRNTIEWSYNLLNPSEQVLFRRLALFVGGCTLEAAQAVCEGGQDVAEIEFLQILRSLVNKSLLQTRHLEPADDQGKAETEPETRLVMLETVREYALEHLEQDPDLARLRQRQLEYYHSFARQAMPQLQGVAQLTWLARLEREHPNLRTALTWAEMQDVETGLRLAAALAQFWDFRSYLNEGRQWLQKLLARSEGQATAGRAVALNAAGNLAQKQGDYAAAITFQEESLALHRQLGDRRSTSLVLNNLGVMFYHQGQYEQAGKYYRESLLLKREIGSPARSIAMSLNNLGELAQLQGHSEQASAYYEEALALQRGVGDGREIAILLLNLGELASLRGDQRRAATFLAESLQLFYNLERQSTSCCRVRGNGPGRGSRRPGHQCRTIIWRVRFFANLYQCAALGGIRSQLRTTPPASPRSAG